MRGLIATLGFGTAASGLALVGYQAFLWVHNGFWTPITFSDLWFALGGIEPERLSPGRVQDILAGLLVQPLSLVLFLVGGCMVWLGTMGGRRPWTRL